MSQPGSTSEAGFEPVGLIQNNPVFWREIQRGERYRDYFSSPFRRWMLALSVIFLAAIFQKLIGLFLFGLFVSNGIDGLWLELVLILMAVIVFVVPPLSATAINKEREARTLDMLALTRLTAAQIFLGKWLGVQYLPFCLLVAGFPLALLFGFAGNVGFFATLLAFLYLIINLGFFACVGLVFSFYGTRMSATTSSIIFSIVLILLTFLVDQAFRGTAGWSPFIYFNPFYSVEVIGHSGQSSATGLSLVGFARLGLGSDAVSYDWEGVLSSSVVEVGFMVGSLFCMTRHYRLRSDH